MSKEKIHLRVAKRDDGSLTVCDQDGREISGVIDLSINLSVESTANVNLLVTLKDSDLNPVVQDKLDIVAL